MKQRKNAVRYFKLLACCAAVLCITRLKAQESGAYIHQAKQIKDFMDTVRNKMPVEKLYLHLDRFNYLAGDTIWFKAYLLEGAYLTPSAQSGIFYVELLNTENKVLTRMKLPARYGLGWGCMNLDKNDLPEGSYVLRAYTNWILNFGQQAVFTTNIYISNPGLKALPLRLSKTGTGLTATPKPKTSGVADLQVSNLPGQSQLEVTISALTADSAADHYLVALSRGVVCYAVPVSLKPEKIVKAMEKQLFPTGITRFVLLNNKLEVISERMVYIDQQDQLKFNFSTAHAAYKVADSVSLRIRVTDKNNLPVQGSFSLSVTDNGQTSIPAGRELNTYMLRTSDSLLYNSGKVTDWKKLVGKKTKYNAEPEFIISGRANSSFKGLSEAKISLFLQKPLMFMDTVAGPDGRFVFKNIPISDTTIYKIQARNKKGKSFFVTLQIDEWVPPVFEPLVFGKQDDPILKDTAFVQKIQKALLLKQKYSAPEAQMLNEVNIEAKKMVSGSYNLNGPGGADQTLTERELLKDGKKSLYSLLMERVPGLGTGGYLFPPSTKRKFGLKIKGQLVKIIIDGIDVDQSYEYWQMMSPGEDETEGMQERFQHLKTNLEHFTAEDVKGIEVMYNASYNMKYNRKFLSQAESMFGGRRGLSGVGGISGIDYAYIEITTRSGRGPFMKPTPGTYLYKPIPFSLPVKFHSSGYGATIYWEPNIVTDEKGEAVVSFRAGELPASYSIVMEGSDMNGQLGSVSRPAFMQVTR